LNDTLASKLSMTSIFSFLKL